jgi:hypothetical protein
MLKGGLKQRAEKQRQLALKYPPGPIELNVWQLKVAWLMGTILLYSRSIVDVERFSCAVVDIPGRVQTDAASNSAGWPGLMQRSDGEGGKEIQRPVSSARQKKR